MPPIRLDQFQNRSFDRGAGVVKEALWRMVSFLFFSTAFPWPSRLKSLLLRCFGATIGEGLVLRPGVNIHFPWKLVTGSHVWIGEGVRLLNLEPITIGSHVCVSQEAFLCTGSHDFHSAGFDLISKPISVQSHSWIGARAFVAPGVEIGEGSRIDAGAVVTRSVPAGSTVKSPRPTVSTPPSA